jgi:hypothetical protein
LQALSAELAFVIFLTTTAIEIDEELMNRCVVLTVDEEREQTQARPCARSTGGSEGVMLSSLGRRSKLPIRHAGGPRSEGDAPDV